VSPYYVRPSQEGVYQHYKAINDAVQLPVLVYNVPGRTGSDIANETLERLSKLPNIVGIKDATGDLTRASFQRIMCGPDWVMLSGDDPTALGYVAHGGHGVISVTANVAPDACATFINACLNGEWETALYWRIAWCGCTRRCSSTPRRRRPSSPWPTWGFVRPTCACRSRRAAMR
jgi:4-hydroxy-tetrahydrodipicolinate synthase